MANWDKIEELLKIAGHKEDSKDSPFVNIFDWTLETFVELIVANCAAKCSNQDEADSMMEEFGVTNVK